MNSFNTLRCIINPVEKNDLQDFIIIKTNPKVRKFLGGVISKQEAIRKFENTKNLFVAKESSQQKCLGFIYLNAYHLNNGTELSYEFHPDYWGKGYAYECLHEIIQHINGKDLYAETQTNNIASCKLLEKLGMHLYKKIKRHGEQQSIYKKEVN